MLLTSKTIVGLLMGKKTDLSIMRKAMLALGTMGIPCEIGVSPITCSTKNVTEYARTARDRGIEVIIAGDDMVGSLAKFIAAYTTLPVIHVPLNLKVLKKFDALYFTVPIPYGLSVINVAFNGANEAAFIACSIISIKYPEIGKRLDRQLVSTVPVKISKTLRNKRKER